MAFGGKSWPIDPTDMNLGAIDERADPVSGASLTSALEATLKLALVTHPGLSVMSSWCVTTSPIPREEA